MHKNLKVIIAEVLKAHPVALAIALRQRAKFEGWLKLELAAEAERNGYKSVELETPLPTNRGESRPWFSMWRRNVLCRTKEWNVDLENKSYGVSGTMASLSPMPCRIL
jgi:hypothetical protein